MPPYRQIVAIDMDTLLSPVFNSESVNISQMSPNYVIISNTILTDNSHSKPYMSHDWCDNAPSATVRSKADGDLVNTHIWDERITSDIPLFMPSILPKFRRCVLTYKFKVLYKLRIQMPIVYE